MVVIPIKSDSDVFKARRAGREMAKGIGFDTRDYTSIEIAISELAANMVEHAIEGSIQIETIDGGLEIVSEDSGPGIEDIEVALKGEKGSRTGLGVGLGIGLASVKRLMDHLEINSEKGRGARIITRKWKVKPGLTRPRQLKPVPKDGLLKYGVVSIPCCGSEYNGDAFVIREFERKVLMAVIDGLGHGENASVASSQGADYVQENYHHGLTDIIQGCHQVLRGTRGAVMGLVRLDLERQAITCAGVGNITIRLIGKKPMKAVSAPGIVGYNLRRVLEEQFPYCKGDLIIMHSDGISDRFEAKDVDLKGRNLQEAAEYIAGAFGKDIDDTTVIVAAE